MLEKYESEVGRIDAPLLTHVDQRELVVGQARYFQPNGIRHRHDRFWICCRGFIATQNRLLRSRLPLFEPLLHGADATRLVESAAVGLDGRVYV
jgi:hypothetical protein